MTSNQVNYWANVERERSNKEQEALKSRELAQQADIARKQLGQKRSEMLADLAKQDSELTAKYGTSYAGSASGRYAELQNKGMYGQIDFNDFMNSFWGRQLNKGGDLLQAIAKGLF